VTKNKTFIDFVYPGGSKIGFHCSNEDKSEVNTVIEGLRCTVPQHTAASCGYCCYLGWDASPFQVLPPRQVGYKLNCTHLISLAEKEAV